MQYAFIVLAVLACYLRTIQYDFIWDDFNYIINNPILAEGSNFFDLWTKKITVDFWPVSYSYFWILRYFFQAVTWPYHVASIILFLSNSILLLKLLNRLKIKSAFILTLMFCVHPMNVSSVAWVFQMKTELAHFFALLSCLYFLDYFEIRLLRHYFFALGLLALSYLSKISLVFLPFVFLIYAFQRKPKIFKNFALLIPFFFTALAFGCANLFWDQNKTPVPPSEVVLNSDWLFRALLASNNFLFYIKQTFFPLQLMFVHPRIDPEVQSFVEPALAIILISLLLMAVFFMFRNKNRIWCQSFLISFLLLLPALGLSEIYFMRFSYVAEHYLGLAMIGFLFPVTAFLYDKKFGKIIILLFITFLCVQTLIYAPDYQNEKTIFEANILKNPNDYLQHNVLGLRYKNDGDFKKAFYHYQKSVEVHPNAASYYNQASLYEKLSQLDLAKSSYEKSIELNPSISDSYSNLGVVHLKLGNHFMALKLLMKALEVSPNNATVLYNIGYVYEKSNQRQLALDWYTKALVQFPTSSLFNEAVKSMSDVK